MLWVCLTASPETWVNNQLAKRTENQRSSHLPTLTIHFCRCGLVRMRLFPSKGLKPELLVDPFSNVACILILVKKWWEEPQPVFDNQYPLPLVVFPQRLTVAVPQRSLTNRHLVFLSKPDSWALIVSKYVTSPLAVAVRSKLTSISPPVEQNVEYFLQSLSASRFTVPLNTAPPWPEELQDALGY